MTEQEVADWLTAHAIETVRVESVAIDGWLYGKQVSTRKFLAGLAGMPTADLVLVFDVAGTPMFGWSDDWRADIGDILHVPDLGTLVATSRPGTAAVLADAAQLSGEPVPVDPRSVLRRLVGRLDELGYSAKVALELEAYVFAESFDEARALGYTGLTPLSGPSHLGYSTARPAAFVDYMDAVSARVREMGIDWEGWLAEFGPGQIEFNVAPSDPLTTADSAIRVKTAMREVAREQGRSVTFLSKPFDDYPSGLHVNHSLLRDGEPAFFDPAAPEGRTVVMRHWLGGLMASMAASMSFFSPCITSYRRLVEANGPPTTITWGENNKTTAIRSITRAAKDTRFEHRAPAGDANPYLAIAAVLAAGIRGLEDEIEPPAEYHGMAWGLPPTADVERLPNTITRAADALRADERFAEIMGPDLVRHWLESRRWEWLMFHTTGGDPDAPTGRWELGRYFETV